MLRLVESVYAFTLFFLNLSSPGPIVLVLVLLIYSIGILQKESSMQLFITFIAFLCFLISAEAMPRLQKGIGRRRKKAVASFNPSDTRPVLIARKPKQMDNEEGAPESRKRKASTQRSLSVVSDKVESSKEVIGFEGRMEVP